MDTPGEHHNKLKKSKLNFDFLRGPLKKSEIIDVIENYDAILCGDDEIDSEVLIRGSKGKLKFISKYGIGLDKIDLKKAEELNIKITNTPGVNHISVSEHILSLLFCYFKNIHLEYNLTKNSKWHRMIGTEIYNKNVGILGYGMVGQEISKKMVALGMNVSVYDPYVNLKSNHRNIKFEKKLEYLFKNIHILCLTLPLNSETKGIINYKLLSSSRNKLVLVNTSRALVVSQKCLKKALDKNVISAYLTDVLENEPMKKNHFLLNYDNVIITPHIASRTYESVERQGLKSLDNLLKCLK